MTFVRISRRFIRGLKSSLHMILVSLLISVVLNIYLLHLDARGKHDSRKSFFFKNGRSFYFFDQETSRGGISQAPYNTVENNVTGAPEDDYSQDRQDMNSFHDVNHLKSLRPSGKSVDSFKLHECSHIFFKSPRKPRKGGKEFTDSSKFNEFTNITSYVPVQPLSKVRQFLQAEPEVKFEMFCGGIREFEEQNNISVKNFPTNLRYKLSLHVLRTMGYEMKLPGAIIIGVKKGGTTALRFFLNFHPQLKTVRKELDFFRDTQKYTVGLDFYRSKFDFASSNQINIEKSSKYFTSKYVPHRIAENLGRDVKLILCIRNPVNRTVSDFHHTSFLTLKKSEMKLRTPQSEGERFVRLLFDEKGRLRSDNDFITTSLYSIHMKNWLKYFSTDQILIVREEDFRRNLTKVLREVESFLQIETFFQPSMFQHKKRTCFIYDGVEGCSPRWGSELPKPYVNETVKQRLRDLFRPFNREFEKAVGQTFPWTNW